ncbi:hypothetical protein A0H76_3059 [Hepatospora eriocheir]|uniref:Uncharacterized protein n=1 Tax=Hepatospora eriocheir TaxID=1081669 RepID=A0A1X0QAV4_9MICR|nr:hypothetical protein A0H76_3059 [Hepatospora eriocheir]
MRVKVLKIQCSLSLRYLLLFLIDKHHHVHWVQTKHISYRFSSLSKIFLLPPQ